MEVQQSGPKPQFTIEWYRPLAGIGDFDGDQHDDVLLRHLDGRWFSYQMAGRRYASRGFVALTSNVDWQLAGIGDLNGDGRDDVLVRNRIDGRWVYYAMNGRSRIHGSSGYANLTRNLEWELAAVGDFDGGGHDDVLLRHPDGRWFYYPMDGRYYLPFGRGVANLSGDPEYSVVATGDFDGNGVDELFLRHFSGRWLHYTMSGRRATRRLSNLTTNEDWNPAGLAPSTAVYSPTDFDLPRSVSYPFLSRFANDRFYLAENVRSRVSVEYEYNYDVTVLDRYGQMEAKFRLGDDAHQDPLLDFTFVNNRFYCLTGQQSEQQPSGSRKVLVFDKAGKRVSWREFQLERRHESVARVAYFAGLLYFLDAGGESVHAYTLTGDWRVRSDFDVGTVGAAEDLASSFERLFVLVPDITDDWIGTAHAFNTKGERSTNRDFPLRRPWSTKGEAVGATSLTFAGGRPYLHTSGEPHRLHGVNRIGRRGATASFALEAGECGNRYPEEEFSDLVYAAGSIFVFVSDADRTKVDGFAYSPQGERRAALDLSLDVTGVGTVRGIVYAGRRFRLLDAGRDLIRAYSFGGARVPGNDIGLLAPQGVKKGLLYAEGRLYVMYPEWADAYRLNGRRDDDFDIYYISPSDPTLDLGRSLGTYSAFGDGLFLVPEKSELGSGARRGDIETRVRMFGRQGEVYSSHLNTEGAVSEVDGFTYGDQRVYWLERGTRCQVSVFPLVVE